jgi:hypothetical protein
MGQKSRGLGRIIYYLSNRNLVVPCQSVILAVTVGLWLENGQCDVI